MNKNMESSDHTKMDLCTDVEKDELNTTLSDKTNEAIAEILSHKDKCISSSFCNNSVARKEDADPTSSPTPIPRHTPVKLPKVMQVSKTKPSDLAQVDLDKAECNLLLLASISNEICDQSGSTEKEEKAAPSPCQVNINIKKERESPTDEKIHVTTADTTKPSRRKVRNDKLRFANNSTHSNSTGNKRQNIKYSTGYFGLNQTTGNVKMGLTRAASMNGSPKEIVPILKTELQYNHSQMSNRRHHFHPYLSVEKDPQQQSDSILIHPTYQHTRAPTPKPSYDAVMTPYSPQHAPATVSMSRLPNSNMQKLNTFMEPFASTPNNYNCNNHYNYNHGMYENGRVVREHDIKDGSNLHTHNSLYSAVTQGTEIPHASHSNHGGEYRVVLSDNKMCIAMMSGGKVNIGINDCVRSMTMWFSLDELKRLIDSDIWEVAKIWTKNFHKN